MPPDRRSTGLGYRLAAAAATMWALNGSLVRLLLNDGVDALRLAQLRAGVTAVILVVVLGVARRRLLRVARSDLPRLAWLGIPGLAGVSAAYFYAIDHLQIGAALTIQYLGPLLILLWLRLVHGRRLRPGLWGAALLSLVGCFLVVRAYDVRSLDALGVAAAFGAAIAFALYLVASERAGRRYEPVTTLVWGFGFASVFWAVVQPLWSFPFERFDSGRNLALGLAIAIVGTLLPFICMVAALRHIPAPRAAVVATLEPVLAALTAYFVLGEALTAPQIAGGLLVVVAVIWVQLQAVSREEESAPEQTSRDEEPFAAVKA